MTHTVLLGDSIFDNRSYTSGEPDVVTHLRASLPEGARATLLAVDGATTRSLSSQLTGLWLTRRTSWYRLAETTCIDDGQTT